MKTLNRLEIMGYLGQDAEIRYMQNGDAVATLSVGTTERWKDRQGNEQENTQWHRVTCFGHRTDLLAKYGKKGRAVRVVGRLQTRKYTDKNNQDAYSLDIICLEFDFMDSKPKDCSQQNAQNQESNSFPSNDGQQMANDIPA